MSTVATDENAVVDEHEDELDETSAEFVRDLVLKLLLFTESFCDTQFFPYQTPIAFNIIESIVLGDGEEKTLIATRQSGKSEVLSNVIAAMMVILPRLANVYPVWLGKFKDGFWAGVFAPTEDQADTVFGRVVNKLTSEHAMDYLLDPEIDDKAHAGGSRGKGKIISLRRSGSFCRMQTCNPKAKIESKTYHFALVDECFPAGTPVLTSEGWVPIDEVVLTSSHKDWRVATQGDNGTVEWSYVVNTYRTPRRQQLVRVDFEHGSVYATANHPFVVEGSRVSAINLIEGTYLSVVQGAPQPFQSSAAQKPRYSHMLPSASSRAIGQGRTDSWAEQSNEVGGGSGEGFLVVEGTGPQATEAGGQRSWFDNTPEATIRSSGGAGAGVDPRVCHRYWGKSSGLTAVPLQGGLGAPILAAGGGSGWKLTPFSGEERAGSPEGSALEQSRVDGIEVLQQGHSEFSQFSDGGDYVYTLEVASESHTYIAGGVLVGNCQEADEGMIKKSIKPMLAWNNGTIVLAGTARREKSYFYTAIQYNKRRDINSNRGHRQSHHEYDWRVAAKYNKNYGKYIEKEKLRIGEDSDEFKMSYENQWLLEKGMFVSDERLEKMYDPSMGLVKQWWNTQIVVGIDVARSNDSTIVTPVWVDWDHPDGFGFYEHRVLNWLEINNVEWEEQYFEIIDFLRQYNVLRVGVDAQGVGGAVAERLSILLPHIDVVSVNSDAKTQNDRWTHLTQLIQRNQLLVPGHSKARRTRPWKRFNQQMSDLEKVQRGPYMLAAAPDERGAFDDYPDSLAIACAMSIQDTMPTVTAHDSPFHR